MIKITTFNQFDGKLVDTNEVASTIEEVIGELQKQGFEYDHWTCFWIKDDHMVFLEEM